MTPAARAQTAIEALDQVLQGVADGPLLQGPSAEAVLTRWARRARYAGSGDRAAVRDLVFAALRRLRSAAAAGGGFTGRGVVAGLLSERGEDPDEFFTGGTYAPSKLTVHERSQGRRPTGDEALDMPSWLMPELREGLGTRTEDVCRILRERAPIHLRANLAKTDREGLIAALAEEGIEARAHPLSPTAVEIIAGDRRLRGASPMRNGWAEPQDAASQAVADFVPVEPGMRVLDICAGGGGKALALAARGASVSAWDVEPRRMADIPVRARRAGVKIDLLKEPGHGWDLILCDAPCSGSGAWRRSPEGKWRLTRGRLQELVALQKTILADARKRVSPGGCVVYATCSLLACENRHDLAEAKQSLTLTPSDGGDGFHAALFEP